MGYNLLTNLLVTSWDIQARSGSVYFFDGFGEVPKTTRGWKPFTFRPPSLPVKPGPFVAGPNLGCGNNGSPGRYGPLILAGNEIMEPRNRKTLSKCVAFQGVYTYFTQDPLNKCLFRVPGRYIMTPAFNSTAYFVRKLPLSG